MQNIRRRLRSFTWLALVALLGLALLPTVSHALASTGGFDPWADVCSAARAADGPAPPALAVGMALDHCPLCSVAAHAPTLPSVPRASLPVPDGADFIAALFVHAPHTPFAWARAQPRGPPAVS